MDIPRARRWAGWLARRAENLAVILLAVMALAFLAQILFRYVLGWPTGWTSELTVVCWLWLVLWGAGLVVREREEIRFDLLSAAAPPRWRRAMAAAALALLAIYGISLPAAWDYVTFMRVQSTAYLDIRFDLLYSVFLIFTVASLVRYAALLWAALRGRDPVPPGEIGGQRLVIEPFLLSLLALAALSLFGLPIGHAMIAGSILYLLAAGLDMGTAAEQILNGLYASYILIAVPLFILAAEIMNAGTVTARLLAFCNAIVGRFPGGLALVNVVQSVIFAGMSGSAIADAAGTGKMMQTMMTADGRYPPAFAAALTAATAVIGPIIPPSIPVVLYGLVSDASVGYLFLGGVVPGLLMGVVQAGLVLGTARRRRFPVEPPVPLRALPRITLEALPALLMPVVLLGGIYGGATTPTEAAAVAALYALLVSAFLYRSLSWRDLYASLAASARTTASIGMLIAGALVFNYVVTVENIPDTVRVLLAGYDLSPLTYLLAVNVLLLILGCLLEGTTILLVVVPVLVPAARELGIDMVHFGIVVVVNIMIGLITPPYGLLLFIMTGIAQVSLGALIREVMPFLIAMIGALLLITLFPSLVLWLPRLFGYQG